MNKKTECLSNFRFHFVGAEFDNIKSAVEFATLRHPIAKGWEVDDRWLIFHWHAGPAGAYKYTDVPDIIPFLCQMDAESMCSFIKQWLATIEPQDEEWNLNVDDEVALSADKGYEILTDIHNTTEIFRVRPIWALYQK